MPLSVPLVTIILTAAMLSACAATDTYSSRAKTYNTESEELSNEMLLLNIVRASQRLPLQFTDLQSVTGQTTSAGSIGLSTPVGGFPAATTRTINPAVTGGLQTTFQAAILSSQEFYQGVSSPISAVQASYFVKAVKPTSLIFSLLFQRIVIVRSDGLCKDDYHLAECSLSIVNDPRNVLAFDLFQTTLDYLIRLGLTMENVKVFNREHKDEDKTSGKDPSRTITDTTKDDNKRDVARYCFTPRDPDARWNIVDKTFECDQRTALAFFKKSPDEMDQGPDVIMHKDLVKALRIVAEKISLDPRFKPEDHDFDDMPKKLQGNLENFQGKNVRIELTPRSTLGIFDYLGSLVHVAQQGSGKLPAIHDSIDMGLARLPCDLDSDDGCSPLFVLSSAEDGPIAVDFHGREYAVPGTNSGYTNYVLAILKQILGLNTTSKNVPVPAIITGFPPL